jgi:hypothetical protein
MKKHPSIIVIAICLLGVFFVCSCAKKAMPMVEGTLTDSIFFVEPIRIPARDTIIMPHAIAEDSGWVMPFTDYDTVPCIMLISDSARRLMVNSYLNLDTAKKDNSGSIYYGGSIREDTTWINPNKQVIQYFGYSVREKHWRGEGMIDAGITPNTIVINGKIVELSRWEWVHIKYLDQDKKELKPNIVVWMSQPLNKTK